MGWRVCCTLFCTKSRTIGRGPGLGADKVNAMNPEQLQSLAVLALAMVPVAVLWWVWIRMLD
jgi:hypothetical protein